MSLGKMQADLLADLDLFCKHPQFIDINHEEYSALLKEQSDILILALAQQVYNNGLPSPQTYVLHVRARDGSTAQIFQTLAY
jgi:hypothetical protein